MSLLEQPRAQEGAATPVPVTEPPARRRRTVLATAAALVAGWALAPHLVQLDPPQPSLPVEDGLFVDGYGPQGTYALHYRYGETVTLTLHLGNDSVLPWRITSVELVQPTYPLLEPVGAEAEATMLPFGNGEVELSFEYTNCRYYHERANNSYDEIVVTGTVLGREVTRTVTLATPLVVHSQVILNCPERTLTRGDDRRL